MLPCNLAISFSKILQIGYYFFAFLKFSLLFYINVHLVFSMYLPFSSLFFPIYKILLLELFSLSWIVFLDFLLVNIFWQKLILSENVFYFTLIPGE